MRRLLKWLFFIPTSDQAPWCPSCQEPHYLVTNKMNWKRC